MSKFSSVLLSIFIIPLLQNGVEGIKVRNTNPWADYTALLIDQVEKITEAAIKSFDQTMDNFLTETTTFLKKAGGSYNIQTSIASQDLIKLIQLSSEDAKAQGGDVKSCVVNAVQDIQVLPANSQPQVTECTSRFIQKAADLVEEAKNNVTVHEQVVAEMRAQFESAWCKSNYGDCLDQLIKRSIILEATVPGEIDLETMDVPPLLDAVVKEGARCVLDITERVTQEMISKTDEKVICIYSILWGK